MNEFDGVIKTKLIKDRIELVKNLENLVFNSANKQNEYNNQDLIQKLLMKNLWVFGEQYHLSVNDDFLERILKKHITDKTKISRVNEQNKFMISCCIPHACVNSHEYEYLIINNTPLKTEFDVANCRQFEEYVFSVTSYESFSDTSIKWNFWVLTNTVSDHVNRSISQKDRPKGLLYQSNDGLITIKIISWRELLDNCQSRLEFFEKNLNTH